MMHFATVIAVAFLLQCSTADEDSRSFYANIVGILKRLNDVEQEKEMLDYELQRVNVATKGVCDTASGAGPHDMTCLRQWWATIGCRPGGTHSPDNKPDLAWWQARTVAEVKADMNLFKAWADDGMAGYVEKCYGAGSCEATVNGPHDMSCLRQWWAEVGCRPQGTHSPDNKPDLAWWQARTVSAVKADMLLFKQWADGGTTGYNMKCYGPDDVVVAEVTVDATAADVQDLLEPDVTDEEVLTAESEFYTVLDDVIQLTDEGDVNEVKQDINATEPDPAPGFPVDTSITSCLQPGQTSATCTSSRALRSYPGSVVNQEYNTALGTYSQPDKRLIGAIIQIGLASLSLASSITVLVSALEGGCNIHRSICTDKETIITLLAQLETEGDELARTNKVNQISYVDLKECMVNNRYVLYYTNKTVESVREYKDFIQDLENELKAKNSDIEYLTNATDMSGEQLLNLLFGPIERSMADLDAIIDMAKEQGLHQAAMNIGIRLALITGYKLFQTWIVDSYKTAAKNVKIQKEFSRLAGAYDAFEDITDNANAAKNLGKVKSGLGALKDNFKTKFPKLSGTLGEMGKKVGKVFSLKNKKINVRKVANEYLKKITTSAKSTLTSIKSKYSLLKQRKFGEFFQTYKTFRTWKTKTTWGKFKTIGGVAAKSLGAVASVAGDVAAIVMDRIKWDQVAASMTEARIAYENRLTSTRSKQVELNTQTTDLDGDWVEVADTFKTIVNEGFKHMLNTTTGVLDLIKDVASDLDIDRNSPLFREGYYDDLTKANLKSKQAVTMGIVNPIREGFFKVREIFRGMKLYAVDINTYVGQGETVKQMQTVIQGVMRHFEVDEVKIFGTTVTVQKILCTIAVSSKPRDAFYDGYALEPFRTKKCELTDAEWQQISQNALRNVFNDRVNALLGTPTASKTPIQSMLDSVVNTFESGTDQAMTDLAKALTKKDILCLVAKLTDEAVYDYYQMPLYRDNACSAITDAQYQASEAAANSMRGKIQTVRSTIETCSTYNFCPCFIKSTDITVDDFKFLAPIAVPSFTQYCVSESQKPCDFSCIP